MPSRSSLLLPGTDIADLLDGSVRRRRTGSVGQGGVNRAVP
jgi:hypothetical protein